MASRRDGAPGRVRGVWVAVLALMLAAVTGCDSGTDNDETIESAIDMVDGKVCGLIDPGLVRAVLDDEIRETLTDYINKFDWQGEHRCVVWDTSHELEERIDAEVWEVTNPPRTT